MTLRSCSLGLLALVFACSSGGTASDAGGDDASDATDAAPESGLPGCDTSKPFGAPAVIAELSTAADDLFPRLTHDELTVYFERYASADAGVPGEKGGSDLLVAARPSVATAFGAPTLLASVNSAANDFDPTVTGDDLTLYFASTRPGGAGGADLWVATRADTTASFGTITNLTSLNTAVNEHTPYALADGLTLYYTGTAGSSLVRATRTSTTPFAVDTSGVLDGVNTSNNEVSPVVTPDDLTLYFASARAGSQMLDIYEAARASTAGPFGSVARVAEVDTTGNDVPAWISDDGCRLYMQSDVAGSYDLYLATKP